jgi:hypothetical protein
MGAAALMQGYPARCGFGITLARNQTVEATPIKKKITLGENLKETKRFFKLESFPGYALLVFILSN